MNIKKLFTDEHNGQIIVVPYANLQANLCVSFCTLHNLFLTLYTSEKGKGLDIG